MMEDDNGWTVSLSSSSPDSCCYAAPPGWQIHTPSTKFALSTSTTSAKWMDTRRWVMTSGGVERTKGGQQSDSTIAVDLLCREEQEELCQGPTEWLPVGQWCVVARKHQDDVKRLEILPRMFNILHCDHTGSEVWWSGDAYAWMAAHTSMCSPEEQRLLLGRH